MLALDDREKSSFHSAQISLAARVTVLTVSPGDLANKVYALCTSIRFFVHGL